MTKIEWAEDVWNPIVGCSVISPGCTNCYAMRDAWRKSANPKTPQYHGLTRMTRGGPVWTGEMRLHEPALTKPLKRRKPTMYFVNSMSDLFHESVQDAWLDQVFAVMALCPQHRFLILTKRADRMRAYMTRLLDEPLRDTVRRMAAARPAWKYGAGLDIVIPAPNVWLGVSAEDQPRADERIPHLLATPAAVRFVSVEPMLGPVSMLVTDHRGHDIHALRGIAVDPTDPDGADKYYRTAKLDWVIVGGESGPNARPMHLDHARDVVRQCQAAGVPPFVKQLGRQCVMNRHDAVLAVALGAGWDALEPGSDLGTVTFRHRKGGDPLEWPADMRVQQFPEVA
jgi:protein gp37